jgi:hypothetical protein
LGFGAKLKAVIGGMTTVQKVMTIVVAVMVPLGVWFGLGFPVDMQSLGELAAAEIVALVAAFGVVFGVSPPTA